MGFRIKKRNSEQSVDSSLSGESLFGAFRVSYDDLDALLQLAGVIAALILSFILGLNFALEHDEYSRYDLHGLIRFSEFRTFAVAVLDNEDASCQHACNTAATGAWMGLCVAECNKHAIDWTFTDPLTQESWDLRAAMLKAEDYDWSTNVPELEAVSHILVEKFPMTQMLVWSTLKDKDHDMLYHRGSSDFLSSTWWSVNLTLTSLLVSILWYVTLQVSNAREGGADMHHWARWGMVGLIIIYASLCAGLAAFFYSSSSVLWSRFPAARKVTRQTFGPRAYSIVSGSLAVVFTVTMTLILPIYRKRLEKQGLSSMARVESVGLPSQAERDRTGTEDIESSGPPPQKALKTFSESILPG